MHGRTLTLFSALAVAVPGARSGSPPTVAALTSRLASMTAVTGFEQAMADSLQAMLPGATRDRAGNVIVRLGTGVPKRLVACPMDEAGYIVGGLQDGGYLTLRRVGRPEATLQDQWMMGRRAVVWSASGPKPGVVSVPSVHLLGGRPRNPTAPAYTVDQLTLDIGATSVAQLQSLGVVISDPVAAEKDPVTYGDSLIAAPAAGIRGACAALASAVLQGAKSKRGSVVVAFVVESRLGHRGLRTAAAEYGPFTLTMLLNYPMPRRSPDDDLGAVTQRNLTVKYAGSPVETVNLHDVQKMVDDVTVLIGGGR